MKRKETQKMRGVRKKEGRREIKAKKKKKRK